MDTNYQDLFDSAFVQAINAKFGTSAETPNYAYDVFIEKSENGRTKFDLWKQMSVLLNVTPKKIHDYFHNTWSKQFCDNIYDHRPEIERIIAELVIFCSIKDLVVAIQCRLQVRYPTLKLHYQTLYQFVNYQVKILNDNKQNKKKQEVRYQNAKRKVQSQFISQNIQHTLNCISEYNALSFIPNEFINCSQVIEHNQELITQSQSMENYIHAEVPQRTFQEQSQYGLTQTLNETAKYDGFDYEMF
ncbi:Conserved_hypothetical protein [Hexamita inflata]|uniref:Uncharacterized protein n=1 Tax=Hexamita inflata TaxID=28002 RepID=A0AA86QL94_9EUKA|nr:Conserved hypothetical protein [Hexamita inflata]